MESTRLTTQEVDALAAGVDAWAASGNAAQNLFRRGLVAANRRLFIAAAWLTSEVMKLGVDESDAMVISERWGRSRFLKHTTLDEHLDNADHVIAAVKAELA